MFCVLLLLFTRGREKARERESGGELRSCTVLCTNNNKNKNNNCNCNYGTYQKIGGDLSTTTSRSRFSSGN